MKYLFQHWALFILLLINFRSGAQDTSFIDTDTFVPEINAPVQSLQNHLRVEEDKGGKWQLSDFLRGHINDNQLGKITTLANPDPFSVWWCKLIIKSPFTSDDFFDRGAI